ncbi:period circadian protein homolog 2 isoform X2 [Esox lucius]|uniref:period circadian protein homolog 2 isoform X2 n=1 Tax=Esox lucius TaxID=8010 RepID=UPI0014768D3E|nr:period circadian protein homolog 2 isoform X2 [Esox lucius]
MSEASAKQYFTVEGSEMDRERNLFQIEENGGSPCEPVSQLHCMSGFGEDGGAEVEPELGLASEGSDSSQDQPASPSLPHDDRKRPHPALHEDVEMTGCGSGSGTESHGNESHGNESHGNVSLGSFNGNSCSAKDSALLESSGSNKRNRDSSDQATFFQSSTVQFCSNTHSPSPPSSSIAFSLVSSEQDNPSTSGCSSEQSAKAKTQKELCKTLKELKMHPPSDKRCKGKASTLHTLTYALRCVKQVQASEEYYRMLMIKDRQPPGLEMSSYTVEEISSITSEYTNKNTDMFAVTVSLITGRIVYISDQATTILHCHRDRFSNAKFVEFLTPQDVSVFYSFTAPYRLPSWSMCTGSESSPSECMQEKSFFCRISGGKEREGSLQYYPFRMTPYLMKVQGAELSEEQFCCLLLAERVHSGYDAPRIPSDKRIFTTTHTPSCLFQEVDERAVPLLGYLPQDLKGTPVLLHLHPSDRPLMLAVHRKILQSVGQPFDHSIRFCARNGEYITIDTSWSSFVNPWSRKVSFVIGRHKVRMGPVNEDVFAVPAFTNEKLVDPDTREITEQIHRTLLQPVHNMGSSGYGSHGSNASHEPLRSVASPSESNSNGNVAEESGKSKPRTFQEICKGVHMLKNQEQQVYQLPSSKLESTRTTERAQQQESLAVRVKESAVPPLSVKDSAAPGDVIEELICKDQTVYSYQQISCLDGVVRYLESCNVPITVKRRYQLSSNTTSSNSDEDKKGSERSLQVSQDPGLPTKALKKRPSGAAPVVGGHMSPLAPPNKADSVVSITSQCSYSSTIVHVGDKKPQPDSEITEDVAESPAPPMLPVCVVSPPSQEKEAYKRLGLTKHVLAAHTQKEEQAFLTRCKDLKNARTFQKHCSNYLHRQRVSSNTLDVADTLGVTEQNVARPEISTAAAKKGSRNKKSKKPRMKRPDSSDSAVSHRMPLPPLQGLNQTSWSPSEASQSQAFPIPYPAIVPGYPLPVYPAGPATPDQPTCPDPSLSAGFGEGQSSLAPPTAAPYPASLMTPVVALVVPNYLFPQIGPIGQIATAPGPSFFPEQPAYQPQTSYPAQQPFQTAYTSQQPFSRTPSQTTFNPQQAFQVPQPSYATQQPSQTTYTTQQPSQTTYTTQQPSQTTYTTQQPSQATYTTQQPSQTTYTTQQPSQATYTTQQPSQATYTTQQPSQTTYTTQQPSQTTYTTQQPFPAQMAYTAQPVFPSQPSFPVQAQFVPQVSYPTQAFPFGLPSESPKSPAPSPASHCSTPASTAREPASSPPLFESRCSSPLQLNLLQLDDSRSAVGQDSVAPPSGAPGSSTAADKSLAAQSEEDLLQVERPGDAHSDGHSSSSDLLDMVLHDETDSTFGSGSGSGCKSGSGSNDTGTSSGASGSRNGGYNTSRYFGSVDSLEKVPKATVVGKTRVRDETKPGQNQGDGEHLGYVPQEPFWMPVANASDDNIMMNYEVPSRDIQNVLRQDKERLRQMQKCQPHFSSVQRRELVEVHPWMKRGILPKTINVKECLYCEDAASAAIEEDHPNMEEEESVLPLPH